MLLLPLSSFFLFLPHSFIKKWKGEGNSGNIWLHINYWLSCFLLFLAIMTFTKGQIFTGQTRHSFWVDPTQLTGKIRKRDTQLDYKLKGKIPLWQIINFFWTSLAFIIVEGKLGLVWPSVLIKAHRAELVSMRLIGINLIVAFFIHLTTELEEWGLLFFFALCSVCWSLCTQQEDEVI